MREIIDFIMAFTRDNRKRYDDNPSFIEKYGRTAASLAVLLMCGIILLLKYAGIINIS